MSTQFNFQFDRPRSKFASRWIDISGQTFGDLRAVRYLGKSKWECVCVCGQLTEAACCDLRRGTHRSCGHDQAVKHGHSRNGKNSPTYRTWLNMRDRCLNPRNKSYAHYGGRGIGICERWKQSFENFLADMGERPKGKGSIDRIDNNGNYEPSNCRWATQIEQGNNTRSCVMVTYQGKTQTITQWAREAGLPRRTLTRRLHNGWSVERALTEDLIYRWSKCGKGIHPFPEKRKVTRTGQTFCVACNREYHRLYWRKHYRRASD